MCEGASQVNHAISVARPGSATVSSARIPPVLWPSVSSTARSRAAIWAAPEELLLLPSPVQESRIPSKRINRWLFKMTKKGEAKRIFQCLAVGSSHGAQRYSIFREMISNAVGHALSPIRSYVVREHWICSL